MREIKTYEFGEGDTTVSVEFTTDDIISHHGTVCFSKKERGVPAGGTIWIAGKELTDLISVLESFVPQAVAAKLSRIERERTWQEKSTASVSVNPNKSQPRNAPNPLLKRSVLDNLKL